MKEQRRRKAAARASFLDDPWIPLVNRVYYGKASQATKNWKRQWARMLTFVRKAAQAKKED